VKDAVDDVLVEAPLNKASDDVNDDDHVNVYLLRGLSQPRWWDNQPLRCGHKQDGAVAYPTYISN
jgi:hypothetical protein